MVNRITKGTLLCFALPLITLPAHSDVYKWTDSSGGIHYSDQMPRGEESTLIKTSKSAERAGQPENSLDQQIDALQENEAIEKLKTRQEQEIAATEKQTEQYCQSLRANINTLANNARIRVKGEDGELRFLTAEEIVEKKKTSEQSYAERCSTSQP